jgi:hypothetical protein
MMSQRIVIASYLSIAALTMGCASESESDSVDGVDAESTESTVAPLCNNPSGVNSVMTALAVATAKEMKRLLPLTDFYWDTGRNRLAVSSAGFGRCGNWCPNVVAVLSMQDAPSKSVEFPGSIFLDPAVLRSTLKSYWNKQAYCGWSSGTCQQEAYDMAYRYWEYGSCEVKYFFDVYKPNWGTRITDATTQAALLDNMIFAGYPENRMLNLYTRNGQFSIDPTGGLNEGGTATSGACTLACTKYSTTNIAGKCCICNGATRTFVRSAFSTSYYQCK